jgi:serine/threonine-protein kinase
MPIWLNSCDPDRLRLLAEDSLPLAEMPGLESHLQDCPGCRETLDHLVRNDRWLSAVRQYLTPDPSVGQHATPSPEAQLGFLAPSDWPDSLGRLGWYEVKGVLGCGGMGVVLKAFDPSLSRNVAIKVLTPPFATSGAARRRFLREARAAAAVVHEHVVAVHAVVETESFPFLVMEYVPGRSLQDRLDAQGPLALAEVLRIGMQTAAGLAAAHAQGLVHRDVKPANILLENGVERVRLTDFGLARAAADAGLTQSGVVIGTPNYMAPEQARGERADHRADLFSLGSTLYAACAGHPPFRAENAVAVLRRVSDDEPRPLREINAEVPAWLEAIIAKLHAKNLDERFQSASEVADLLGRCLAHVQQPLSVALPPEVLVPQSQPRARRSRRLRKMLVALGLAAVACGSLALLSIRPNGHNATHGVRPASRPTGSGGPQPAQPSGLAAEEIAQQIKETWTRARAIEAELHRRSEPCDDDPLSLIAQALSARAQSLEREIVTARDTISR